jgi:hypothetical protein
MNDDFLEIIPLDDDAGVQEVLTRAVDEELEYVLVIGRKDDGWYFAASEPDVMKALISTEQFRNYMMST